MLLSLTIGRPILALPDLVITNDPTVGDFWLPEDWLEAPEMRWRLTYYPDADDIDGKMLRAAAKDQTSIPAVIYAKGSTAAALAANKRIIEAAVGQFNYPVTANQDGAWVTYSCDPADVRWGPVDSGMVRARIAKAALSIPCHPIPEAVS